MAGGTTKVVLAAVGGNGVITVAKSVGFFLTGSPSLLAEAVHSAADTANQFLIYVGIRHGERGPSRTYPLGQASARYLWNLVSAMGIFFVGFGFTTYHGIHSLIHPTPVSQDSPLIPFSILGMALLIEGAVLYVAWREVRASKGKRSFREFLQDSDDPTAVAILFEDGIAVLGVVLAFIGYGLSRYTQSSVPDAIAAIVIGLLLGVMAIILAVVNGRLLIGKRADAKMEGGIRELIRQIPSVESVSNIVTRVIGPGQIRLGCEIEFHGSAIIDRGQLGKDAERIKAGEEPLRVLVESSRRMVRLVGEEINSLEHKVMAKYPEIVAVDIEVN